MENRNPDAVRMIERMFPEVGVKGMEFLEQLDPSYRRWWENTVFGGLYSREVLDQKTRELCALSALVMTGKLAQIRAHVLALCRRDSDPGSFIFGGAPVVLGALETMVEVYRELEPGD